MQHPPSSPLLPYTTLFRSVSTVERYLYHRAFRPGGKRSGTLRLVRRDHAQLLADNLGISLEHCLDRKSTRLNSSHPSMSYGVFCLKKTNAHKSMVRCVWSR